jgi:hypothetical protein
MKIKSSNAGRCILACALLVMAASAFALSEDDRELTRAAVPDSTPQQLYDSAIREAGGAYKEALLECNALRGVERSSCTREAKATYDHDMAEARALLRPSKR